MYYTSDMWEAWTDLFETFRAARAKEGKDLWINATCYVNLSPWMLQWVNTIWVQDSGDTGQAANAGGNLEFHQRPDAVRVDRAVIAERGRADGEDAGGGGGNLRGCAGEGHRAGGAGPALRGVWTTGLLVDRSSPVACRFVCGA